MPRPHDNPNHGGGKDDSDKKNKKGKKRERKNRQADRRYQRATRDVQLQNQPQIDELNAMLQQAQQDYQRQFNTANSIYGGYSDEIGNIPPTDYNQIADDFQGRLGSVAGLFQGGGVDTSIYGLPVGLPDAEVQAANGLGQTLGSTGLENIYSLAGREGAAREAALREGPLAQRYAQDNLFQQMQDTVQNYQNQLANINRMVPSQIDQRNDELRQQSIENRLANSQIQGDKAFSDYLQQQFGSMATSGNGRGNNGPGNPGPNNNPNNHPGTGGQFGGGYGGYGGGPDTWGGNPPPDYHYPSHAIRNINQEDSFKSEPLWLQRIYNDYQGPDRWDALKNRRQRQIFRATRPHVRDLYQNQDPYGYGS